MRNIALILIFLLITGCASINKGVSWDNGSTEISVVLIYRLPGTHSGALDMYFGSTDGYALALAESEYATLQIPSGTHTFKANSKATKSVELDITLVAGERTCLDAIANPKAKAALFLPFLGAVIHNYKLQEVTYPAPEQLEQYALVES